MARDRSQRVPSIPMSTEQSIEGMSETLTPGPIMDGPIFGPQTEDYILSEDPEIPPEIRQCLEENGLGKKTFTCIISQLPGENPNTGSRAHVYSCRDQIPSHDWIAKNYGPGTYQVKLIWQGIDPDTGRKSKSLSREFDVIISEKLKPLYRKFQMQKRIQDVKETKDAIQDAHIDSLLERDMFSLGSDGQGTIDKRKIAMEHLQEIKQTAEMLGLAPQQRPQIDWEKVMSIAAVLVPALAEVFKSRAAASPDNQMANMMQMMMASNQQSANRLLEYVQNTSEKNSGSGIMEKMTEMIMGSINLKEVIEGKKESVLDKVLKTVEGIAPSFMALAAAPKAVQQPMINQAKSYVDKDPNFQAVRDDPQMYAEFCTRMNETIGTEQMKALLTAMGYPVPDNLPFRPVPGSEEPQDADIVEDSEGAGQ